MAYRVQGLSPEPFQELFTLTEAQLERRNARRVTATSKPGFPCRVTLEDAEPGESLILLHHVSHDVDTPFRAAYAIYVREGATEPATFVDTLPPVFEGRTLSLRGFGEDGMLKGGLLAAPGEIDTKIRALFGQPEIAVIHAHNAVYGCFAAAILRS